MLYYQTIPHFPKLYGENAMAYIDLDNKNIKKINIFLTPFPIPPPLAPSTGKKCI